MNQFLRLLWLREVFLVQQSKSKCLEDIENQHAKEHEIRLIQKKILETQKLYLKKNSVFSTCTFQMIFKKKKTTRWCLTMASRRRSSSPWRKLMSSSPKAIKGDSSVRWVFWFVYVLFFWLGGWICWGLFVLFRRCFVKGGRGRCFCLSLWQNHCKFKLLREVLQTAKCLVEESSESVLHFTRCFLSVTDCVVFLSLTALRRPPQYVAALLSAHESEINACLTLVLRFLWSEESLRRLAFLGNGSQELSFGESFQVFSFGNFRSRSHRSLAQVQQSLCSLRHSGGRVAAKQKMNWGVGRLKKAERL